MLDYSRMKNIFLLFLCLGFANGAWVNDFTIFQRMPEKESVRIDFLYWGNFPGIDEAYVEHMAELQHRTLADQLNQMSFYQDLPINFYIGRKYKSMDQNPPIHLTGGKVEGCNTASQACDLIWNAELQKEREAGQSEVYRMKVCLPPNHFFRGPEGCAGVGGLNSVTKATYFLHSSTGIYPYKGGSLGHEVIHSIGCVHGQGIIESECAKVEDNLKMSIYGGCPGPVEMPRMFMLYDPNTQFCEAPGKCAKLTHKGGLDANGNRLPNMGECSKNAHKRMAHAIGRIGVTKCTESKTDWRGYCLFKDFVSVARQFRTRIKAVFDQTACMDFIRENPARCPSGVAGMVPFRARVLGGCWCISEDAEYTPDLHRGTAHFKTYSSFDPPRPWTMSAPRQIPPEAFTIRDPVYTQICSDCRCREFPVGYRGLLTQRQCLVYAAKGAMNYFAWNEDTKECNGYKTCHYGANTCDRADAPAPIGWNVFEWEGAPRDEEGGDPEEDWEECASWVTCGTVVAEKMIDSRVWKHFKCWDFCESEGLPYAEIAYKSTNPEMCKCYAECSNPTGQRQGSSMFYNQFLQSGPAPTPPPVPQPSRLGQECWTNGNCKGDTGNVCEWCGRHEGKTMLCCRNNFGSNHANCRGADYPRPGQFHMCVINPLVIPTPQPTLPPTPLPTLEPTTPTGFYSISQNGETRMCNADGNHRGFASIVRGTTRTDCERRCGDSSACLAYEYSPGIRRCELWDKRPSPLHSVEQGEPGSGPECLMKHNGCPVKCFWLGGNNACDSTCNTEPCLFDLGDCAPSPRFNA